MVVLWWLWWFNCFVLVCCSIPVYFLQVLCFFFSYDFFWRFGLYFCCFIIAVLLVIPIYSLSYSQTLNKAQTQNGVTTPLAGLINFATLVPREGVAYHPLLPPSSPSLCCRMSPCILLDCRPYWVCCQPDSFLTYWLLLTLAWGRINWFTDSQTRTIFTYSVLLAHKARKKIHSLFCLDLN